MVATSLQSTAIRLHLGISNLPRITRNSIYAHTFNEQTEIENFIKVITGSDDEVAALNKDLFPERFTFYTLRMNGSKKIFVRSLAQELMRSARLDKHEGTKVEINERIIAALSLQKLLQENEIATLSISQLDTLITFNLSIESTKTLGSVREDERILLQSVLDQVIKLAKDKQSPSQS